MLIIKFTKKKNTQVFIIFSNFISKKIKLNIDEKSIIIFYIYFYKKTLIYLFFIKIMIIKFF